MIKVEKVKLSSRNLDGSWMYPNALVQTWFMLFPGVWVLMNMVEETNSP